MREEFEYRSNKSIEWQLEHEGDQVGAWENADVERLYKSHLELHTHREVLRLADVIKVGLRYMDGKYSILYIGWGNLHLFPNREGAIHNLNLTELHAKLIELKGDK